MDIEILDGIHRVSATAWDQLNTNGYPFLRHGFLAALEAHGAVSPQSGWQPQHLTAYDQGHLVAAAPAYIKAHSWGEFVFDFAWADAYERHGGAYYPKLVMAIPFTPATGPRVLSVAGLARERATAALADGARTLARRQRLSSVHWLFPEPGDAQNLANMGYSIRHGCQFHWYNQGYTTFDDFLGDLNSKKRKNIRRERRRLDELGIGLRAVHGDEADADLWDAMYRFYRTTFESHGNLALISRDCFAAMGQSLGSSMVLFVAERDGVVIGGAICFRDNEALYGRYWGCDVEYDGLHFETCYYQGIEYCIRWGLERFEPGAQGEHKVARGFVPTLTRSAHDFPDQPSFQAAVNDFIRRERDAVQEYAESLTIEGAYRDDRRPTLGGADGP